MVRPFMYYTQIELAALNKIPAMQAPGHYQRIIKYLRWALVLIRDEFKRKHKPLHVSESELNWQATFFIRKCINDVRFGAQLFASQFEADMQASMQQFWERFQVRCSAAILFEIRPTKRSQRIPFKQRHIACKRRKSSPLARTPRV